ncbi:MAG: STAS domain-containing protein [Thermoguttaceae bacterium]|jgi:hypothetical protein
MRTVASEWEFDVRRGPGWLLVRLLAPSDGSPHLPPLADQLWSLLESHFVYRLVLELHEIRRLDRPLLGQLVQLYRRIHQHGGMVRLCGLSPLNRRILENHGLIGRLPPYENVEEAVMGISHKPR